MSHLQLVKGSAIAAINQNISSKRAMNSSSMPSFTDIAAATTGGDGGGGEMENRITALETHITHINKDIGEIKTDVREIRNNIHSSDIKLNGRLDNFILGIIGIVLATIAAFGTLYNHIDNKSESLTKEIRTSERDLREEISEIKKSINSINSNIEKLTAKDN